MTRSKKLPPAIARAFRSYAVQEAGDYFARLEFRLPPNANHYRGFDRKRERWYTTGESRDYKREIQDAARLVSPGGMVYGGPVRVSVRVFRAKKSGDLEGFLKVLLDGLQGGFYVDDAQIVRIEAERFDDPERPRVEVEVSSA